MSNAVVTDFCSLLFSPAFSIFQGTISMLYTCLTVMPIFDLLHVILSCLYFNCRSVVVLFHQTSVVLILWECNRLKVLKYFQPRFCYFQTCYVWISFNIHSKILLSAKSHMSWVQSFHYAFIIELIAPYMIDSIMWYLIISNSQELFFSGSVSCAFSEATVQSSFSASKFVPSLLWFLI